MKNEKAYNNTLSYYFTIFTSYKFTITRPTYLSNIFWRLTENENRKKHLFNYRELCFFNIFSIKNLSVLKKICINEYVSLNLYKSLHSKYYLDDFYILEYLWKFGYFLYCCNFYWYFLVLIVLKVIIIMDKKRFGVIYFD